MKKIMKKLTASATRLLVLALCLGLVSTGWAVTTTGYEDFGDAAGVMLWRGGLSTNDFHASTVIDVAADGTCGAEYAMTWANNNAQSSKRFCRTESSGGYSAPGLVLVYDEAGYKDSADSSFTPLSFGGLWVKVLQAANKPYAITGSSNNGRATEFGNSSYDGMTLFKFEKSFTINRQGAFSFNGTVTVDVAQDAVFSINASYPHQSLTIPSGSTLKLTGAGSVAIGNTDNGLVVDGTLDLSSATRPTLTGTNGGAGLVKISNGASLVLPSGTAIGETVNIPVCTGTLTLAGKVNVKVGTGDAVEAALTVSGGTITKIDTDTTATYSSDFPTTIPTGYTYTYTGSNDPASPTPVTDTITVNGTLKTIGYISFSNLQIAASGTFEVVSETATVVTTVRQNSGGNLSGRIIIDAGATMVNQTTDGLDWDGTTQVDIYGTLSMGSTRWSIRQAENCTVNLYMGAQVTGAGDGNGVLDLFNDSSKLNCYATGTGAQATISGPVRFRGNNQYPIWVASGAKLVLSGGTLGNGGFSANGPGEIVLSGSSLNHAGSSLVSDGTVTFDNTTQAKAITVNAGKNLKVVATESTTVVPLNATLAANTCNISLEGSGYANGTVKLSSFFEPSSAQVFLSDSSKWKGMLEFPAKTTAQGQFLFQKYSNSDAALLLDGFTSGYFATANADTTIPGTVKLGGNVTFDNGWSGYTYKINRLAESSGHTLNLVAWNGANSSGVTYEIGEFDGFAGTVNVQNSSGHAEQNCVLCLKVGNIVATAAYDTPLVKITKSVTTPAGTRAANIDLTNATLNSLDTYDLCYDGTVSGVEGVYLAAAEYGNVKYGAVANAIAAYEADETVGKSLTDIHVLSASATIPSGYALVTAAGGAMTLRTAGAGESIYWAAANSGDWLGEDSNGTHTFYTADGSTTPYVAGDTVVITNNTQIWSKTAAHGAKFQIGTDTVAAEVHFTRSGSDCDDYILDSSTVEIKSGSNLVAERYSDTNPRTQTYTQWDSYQNDNPDASSIRDTTITGAGTVKIGGNTGGHGAAAVVLSGTTAISCAIDLADGAMLTVPSGCTVTAPTTSVTDKMVTYSTDSGTGTKTYSVVPVVAKLVNGVDETPYADVMTAIGDLITALNVNPAAYVQVLDGTVELDNAYGGYGIGLDATNRRYAKAAAISGDAGFITVQAAIDAVASEGSITLAANCGDALTLADGKTVTIVAKVGNVTYTYTPPTAVTPASYRVIAGETVDGTTTFTSKALYAVTVPTGVEHASATVNGASLAGGASVQVVAGTNVEIVWTPASGYKITAGAAQTINSIAADTTADSPTVEAKGATVSGVTFSYLGDFAKATVTATVTGDATSATLNYGGAQYVAEVGSGGSVTFDNVVVTRGADIYAPVDYTIDTDAHTTTGGVGKTIAADADDWITEDKDNYETTGSWETDITYDGTTAAATIVDNTYTPTSHPTNDVVTITVNDVVYPDLSDETLVLGDAQAAVCLGTNNASTIVFKVLVTNGTDVAHWAEASGVTANTNRAYDITMIFDYTKGTYSATVDGTALTAAGATSWGLCSSAKSVTDIEFMGAGSITGIHGVVLEGNMIEDGKGNKYATIQAAIDALTADATLAPLTKLHAGTPPAGWKFDGDTLIKIALGTFFFAF